MDHHPIFSEMPRWRGRREPGFFYNFLGVKTRNYYVNQKDTLVPKNSQKKPDLEIIPRLPDFDSEYFDWIEILDSVKSAKDKFVMIELGAGYGRWMVNAAVGVRLMNPVPVKLVAVEAEPIHYTWIKEHFADNGINPKNHQIINKAVSPKTSLVRFWIGNPSEWYGQMIAHDQTYSHSDVLKFHINSLIRPLLPNRRRIPEDKKTIFMKSISLNRILSDHQIVDLVSMDIQEMEFLVIEDSLRQLNQKVKKIHIATHLPELEEKIRALMHHNKWKNSVDYRCMSTNKTPYGDIYFQDGIQTWINPVYNV